MLTLLPRLWPTLLAMGALLFVGGVGVALAIDSTSSGRAGVLDVDAATEAVAEAADAVESMAAEVAAAEAALAGLEADVAALDTREAELVAQLEELVRQNRELVVAAFITGGEADSRRLLGSDEAADYTWRTYLFGSESAEVANVADEVERIRAATDTRVVALAEQLDADKARLAVDQARLGRLEDDLGAARVDLSVAEAWAWSDAAVARGRFGEAPPEAWIRLRFCESSGNYRAVDDTGIYQGAYQFDRRTWRTVGGTGDPIDASPLEQDARARALYALRGSQPWPVCGRYLP